MPTPAWPTAAAEGSPEHRRKYREEREGAVSSTTALESYSRVSERQQTSMDKESNVLANAACCPICFNVRTLNAAKRAKFLGRRKGVHRVLDIGEDNDPVHSVRPTLELGTEEKVLTTGVGLGAEKVRRQGPAVACFRLPTLLYAVGKATLFNVRDGRCTLRVFLKVLVMIVCGLGYCQVAQA